VNTPEYVGESPLSRRIVSYLVTHPHAADTIEGISQGWLWDAQSQPSDDQLQQALDCLAARQLVLASHGGNGRVSYSMNPKKQGVINKLVKGPA